MKRLTTEELQRRIQLVKKYMSLEGSSFNLDTGEVIIQSLVGEKGARKSNITQDGYRYYSLRDAEAKKYATVYLHQIIMIMADSEQYLSQMAKGMTINHINGDKTDNRLSNLEYLTSRDNFSHAYILGLTESPLEDKLSPNEAYELLKGYYQYGSSLKELSDRYSLPVGSIKRIVLGKAYRAIYVMYKAQHKSEIESKIKESRINKSKLKVEDVRGILKDYHVSKVSQIDIARKHNISRSTVGMIATGKRWAEVYTEFNKELQERA